MDKTFEQYLRSGISLEPVGAGHREDNTPYFCTPKGASIFGWAGVDGIHFCFIRGFSGMVFSVSPMNIAPDYVHPVAKDFGDFLRLLLACGDTAALEQAWMWDRSQFETFLRENPITAQQKETLDTIREKFLLEPMEQPWDYLKALQSSFDSSKIKYTADYYAAAADTEPAPPEWKVCFNGDFWGHSGRDKAGKEIRLDRQFDWAESRWVIPAAYACNKGLVVDFCMQVEPEAIHSFRDKWGLGEGDDARIHLTREQRMKMELDDPFCLHIEPQLQLNCKELRPTHGCSVCFDPCMPKGFRNDLEAKWAVDHYGLDTCYGWVICRNAFPWAGSRKPAIKNLSLVMAQQPEQIPGPHIRPHRLGDTFTFTHPASGICHTLTVQSLEHQELPPSSFGRSDMEYPMHYTVMEYTISPEPADTVRVFDCAAGDRPREIKGDDAPMKPPAANACFISIIGGAGGPAAIAADRPGTSGTVRTACSSLHFEPVGEDVEWRIEFQVKPFEEETFVLL